MEMNWRRISRPIYQCNRMRWSKQKTKVVNSAADACRLMSGVERRFGMKMRDEVVVEVGNLTSQQWRVCVSRKRERLLCK